MHKIWQCRKWMVGFKTIITWTKRPLLDLNGSRLWSGCEPAVSRAVAMHPTHSPPVGYDLSKHKNKYSSAPKFLPINVVLRKDMDINHALPFDQSVCAHYSTLKKWIVALALVSISVLSPSHALATSVVTKTGNASVSIIHAVQIFDSNNPRAGIVESVKAMSEQKSHSSFLRQCDSTIPPSKTENGDQQCQMHLTEMY
jgi:hypothetical protein